MFSQAQRGLVWWPVELVQFDEDGNEIKITIRLLFRPFTRKELHERQSAALKRGVEAARRLQEAAGPAEDGTPATVESITADSTDRLLAQVMQRFEVEDRDVEELVQRTHDWRGVKEGEEAVPFARDFLRDLLAESWFYRPVAAAFEACSEGAVRKNSSPGPAGSRGPAQS